MSREKQIEEMAKVLIDYTKKKNIMASHVILEDYAEQLYNAGYRKQEWISVDERLPEQEGETVLYYDGKDVDACIFFSERFHTIDLYESDRIDGVTHWMPLPEPPKMKGGAE